MNQIPSTKRTEEEKERSPNELFCGRCMSMTKHEMDSYIISQLAFYLIILFKKKNKSRFMSLPCEMNIKYSMALWIWYKKFYHFLLSFHKTSYYTPRVPDKGYFFCILLSAVHFSITNQVCFQTKRLLTIFMLWHGIKIKTNLICSLFYLIGSKRNFRIAES